MTNAIQLVFFSCSSQFRIIVCTRKGLVPMEVEINSCLNVLLRSIVTMRFFINLWFVFSYTLVDGYKRGRNKQQSSIKIML